MMKIYDQEHELELLLKETREDSEERGIEIGKEQGIEIGKEQGIEQGIETVILSMLKKNLDYVQVAELTSLPMSKVQELRERFLRNGLLAAEANEEI